MDIQWVFSSKNKVKHENRQNTQVKYSLNTVLDIYWVIVKADTSTVDLQQNIHLQQPDLKPVVLTSEAPDSPLRCVT